jgi:hypothetical protein
LQKDPTINLKDEEPIEVGDLLSLQNREVPMTLFESIFNDEEEENDDDE